MTLRLHLLAGSVDGAPGETMSVPIRVSNAGASAATCRVSVVGLNPSGDDPPVTLTIPAGASVEHVVTTTVPVTLGVGRHAAAIEIASDRPGDRPVLASFAVSIGSVAQVALQAHPATIRGRRHVKFRLEIANNEQAPVDLALSGEAPDVRVRFGAERVQVPPHARVIVPAKVRGPRRGSGEPTQHTLLITAQGHASSTTITTPYIQRALFAHRARMVVAAVTIVALWLGAIGVAAIWWADRANQPADDEITASADANKDGVTDQWTYGNGETIKGVDSDGDGVLDTFIGDQGTAIRFVDTDGDGVPDAFQGADGKKASDPSGGAVTKAGGRAAEEAAALDQSDSETASNLPTATVIRGTVKADGDLSDIDMKLEPMPPDQPQSGISGFAGVQPPKASKYWSARHGLTTDGTLNPVRQTEPVKPPTAHPAVDGVWQFQDVALRETYELTISKPGFDTQHFVVTPPDDASPVVLDIVLTAAEGAISGVVTDSNGAPLTGVAITVTDGTSVFTTAVDDAGAWKVVGVSTPGVFTVAAVKRGYGIEVTQVELTAGQQFDGADLTMVSGVGSIDGRVSGPSGPLGGVKVTATNGETTITTTTLTTGDVGRYVLPRLEFGTYSLLVEAPGYVSQSRRVVDLRGNRTENFGMTRTTVRLTGMVTSDRTGAGVPNAGLILTTGDLKFKATTAVAPNAGSFAIHNLPPGNYTITVVHYQHVTSTQLITLVAGVQPPPLNIVLERTDGLPDVGSGSLVVEVVDPGGDTAAERQIKNATVQLIRTQTGEARPPVTQEAFNFRLDNIPIGTYTLLVTAPRYNPAPARLVSIGLSEQRVEVQLQKLGQASGRVVDSITKQPLTDYFVSLFRQPENPGDAPVFTLAANSTGLWQTPADSLIPGTYRIEITDAASPAGYLVRNDQLLDDAVVGVGDARLMRFLLPEDNDEPVTVKDIEADRYPTITGRVYVPTLSGTTVGYDPVDRNDLAVTMSCGGGTPFAATLSDLTGVRGATPPLLDSFSITSQQIDAGNLVGDCALDVSAGAGLEARRIALPGIDANDGVSVNDRRLHIALAPPAPKIGGKVFWLDGATQVAIPNARIDATRITHFDVTESSAASAAPDAVPEPASTTSDTNGQWDLDGQMWGVADYQFTADNFAPATVTVTVDDSGATATSDGTTTNVTKTAGRFEVELSKPNPRSLVGSITIKSTDGTYDFDHVVITATSPTGGTIVENLNPGPTETAIQRGTPVGGVLPFTIVNALPGTWSVTIATKPDNHDVFGPQLVQDQVPPGSTAYPAPSDPFPGFNLSLVELATLRLTLHDIDGGDVTVTPQIRLVPNSPGTGTITGPVVAESSGSSTFVTSGIKVNPVDPDVNALGYTLFVTVPGYDTTRAKVAFSGDTLPGQDTNVGVSGLGVSFKAGSTVGLTLTLPARGSLEGIVQGVEDASGDKVPLTITTSNLTVTPVDVNGNDVQGVDFTVDISNNNLFTVSGDQGYYRISVHHPQYKPPPLPADNLVPNDVTTLSESTVVGVYRIVNDHVNGPLEFVLDIIPGQLDVNAYLTLADRQPVTGPVTYILTAKEPNKSNVTGTVNTDTTPASPHDTIEETALFPGRYTLEIRQYDDPSSATRTEIAFPVITDITIERAVNNSTPSITVVNAPLPPVAPAVIGTIIAENSNHEPVALPSGGVVTYDVTSTYEDLSAIEINGTTTIPDPTAGDQTANVDDDNASSQGTVTYTFNNVPIGEHEVTMAVGPTASFAAYSLPTATQTMQVVALGPNAGPQFVLTVANVALTVQLTAGDDYPNLQWTLTSPHGHTYTGAFDDDADQLTFAAVAPEIGTFQLALDDDLHAADTYEFPVGPDADGSTTVPVNPAADKGRVTGSATQHDLSGAPTNLSGPATITLTSGGATPSVFTFPVDAGATVSTWTLDVPAGTYQLKAQKTGYADVVVPGITVTAGVIRPNTNVQLEKFSHLDVTLTNGKDLVSPEILLRPQSGPLIPGTAGTSGGLPTGAFDVAAGTYTLVVRATNYRQLDVATAIQLDVGTSVDRQVTLPRQLRVTVSGPGTATVKVFRNAADPSPITVGPKATSTPFDVSSGLPDSGDVIVQVEATNYMTQRVDPVSFTNGALLVLDRQLTVTLRQPPTVTGVLTRPSGTTLSGGRVGSTTAITATSDGQVKVGTATDAGAYSIPGLGVGPNGENRTWTLLYDKSTVGTSSGADTVTITATDSSPVSGPDIVVTARTIRVTFTVVSDVGGGALQNAAVDIAGLTIKTNSSGKASVNLDEDLENVAWSVSLDNFVTTTGTIASFPNRNEYQVPTVTLVSRARTVIVQDAGTGVAGATVTICTITSGACTGASTPLGSGTTSAASAGPPVVVAGQLNFLAPLAAGSYRITATMGTSTGTLDFTVDSTGKASISATTPPLIAIVAPPPPPTTSTTSTTVASSSTDSSSSSSG